MATYWVKYTYSLAVEQLATYPPLLPLNFKGYQLDSSSGAVVSFWVDPTPNVAIDEFALSHFEWWDYGVQSFGPEQIYRLIGHVSISDSFLVGSAPAPTELLGPAVTSDALPTGPFGNTHIGVTYNTFAWGQITIPDTTTLFTTGADTVDFNNLTPAQQAAVASGAYLYDALGSDGDKDGDKITLPTTNNYDEIVDSSGDSLNWSLASTFRTGSLAGDHFAVVGYDGNYKVALGAGSDTVTINGNGNSTITGGTGNATITITGTGANIVNAGSGNEILYIAGGGSLKVDFSFVGSATIGPNSTLELNGTATGGAITFGGTNGTLKIDGTTMPTNVISGFTAGDTIDLKGVAFDNLGGAVVFGTTGLLRVIENGQHYDLQLDPSQIFSGGFELSSDGSGGTEVQLSPTPVTGYSTFTTSAISGLNPYSSVVRLGDLINGNFIGDGSGFVVGPHTILTAAHVAESLLSLTGAALQFDQGGPILINENDVHIHPNYSTTFPLPQFDLAVINVSQDLTSYGLSIGATRPVFQLQANFSSGEVNFTGYPGDVPTVSNDIGTVSGALGAFVEPAGATVEGQSGGPIWTYDGSVFRAVGVITGDIFTGRLDNQFSQADLNFISTWTSSKLSDGYISGATIFADANGNAQLDSGEASATTDSTGGFSLAGGSDLLVAFGGTDTSTGLAFKGQLSAPAGSTDITPLTTLLANLTSDPSAQQKLLSVLGLSSTLDLTTFDPIAAAKGGNADGAATEIAGAKVYDTVEMIASALAGAGGTFDHALQTAFSALASALDGPGINLNDKTALSALITQVAQAENVTLAQGVADAVASVIAAGNIALDHVLQTDQPGAQLLNDVAGIELVMQGAASTAITDAGADLTKLEGIADLFTGAHLSELIAHAQNEVQNPGQDLGPIAFDGSAATDQNTVLNGTVSAIDLMGNTITYAVDGSTPAGLTFNSDGTFSFDPQDAYKYLALGESTNLSFHFNASDGHGTDSTGTETITVNGLNDNPTAAPESNGVAKGKSIAETAAHGVLANDSDPDAHDHLAVGSVNGSAANVGHSVQGAFGAVTLNADGSYFYSATAKALPSQIFAQDTFTYTTVDGHGGSAMSTLTFAVFDPSANYQAGANTTLSGGNGKSILDGSAGHDILLGGDGADVLIGGDGDALTGGNGPDQFVFRPNFGTNTVTDFDFNTDHLQFDKSIFGSTAAILSHTVDTLQGAMISDGHGDSVLLLHVSEAQLQAHSGSLLIA